jgi:hypothetical protein
MEIPFSKQKKHSIAQIILNRCKQNSKRRRETFQNFLEDLHNINPSSTKQLLTPILASLSKKIENRGPTMQ